MISTSDCESDVHRVNICSIELDLRQHFREMAINKVDDREGNGEPW